MHMYTSVSFSNSPRDKGGWGREREREGVQPWSKSYWISTTTIGSHQQYQKLESRHSSIETNPKSKRCWRAFKSSQPPPDCPYIMHREGLHNHHLRTLSNQYFNTNIQKEFTPSVPGCIEHYTKLATAINEAHTHHKSLCICWLDLAKHLWKRTSWPHQIFSQPLPCSIQTVY